MKRYEPIEVVGPNGDDVAMEERPDGGWYHRADLIAAGCLVPVPDGEACEIHNLESDFFIQDQTVYRVPSGEFYGLPLGYEGAHYAAFYGAHDTVVQPVRLVRLEDVG